jgi:hypothetical protein
MSFGELSNIFFCIFVVEFQAYKYNLLSATPPKPSAASSPLGYPPTDCSKTNIQPQYNTK